LIECSPPFHCLPHISHIITITIIITISIITISITMADELSEKAKLQLQRRLEREAAMRRKDQERWDKEEAERLAKIARFTQHYNQRTMTTEPDVPKFVPSEPNAISCYSGETQADVVCENTRVIRTEHMREVSNAVHDQQASRTHSNNQLTPAQRFLRQLTQQREIDELERDRQRDSVANHRNQLYAQLASRSDSEPLHDQHQQPSLMQLLSTPGRCASSSDAYTHSTQHFGSKLLLKTLASRVVLSEPQRHDDLTAMVRGTLAFERQCDDSLWLLLPVELWLLVLSYLDGHNLTRVAQVCAKLHCLANVPELWMALCERECIAMVHDQLDAIRNSDSLRCDSVDWRLLYSHYALYSRWSTNAVATNVVATVTRSALSVLPSLITCMTCAYTPKGYMIATGNTNGAVEVWYFPAVMHNQHWRSVTDTWCCTGRSAEQSAPSLSSSMRHFILSEHADALCSVAIDSFTGLIITTAKDGKINVVDPKSRRRLRSFHQTPYASAVASIPPSTDGTLTDRLVSVLPCGTVTLWSLSSGDEIASAKPSLALNIDECIKIVHVQAAVFAVLSSACCILWDFTSMTPVQLAVIRSAARFSDCGVSGSLLLIATKDMSLSLYNISDPRVPRLLSTSRRSECQLLALNAPIVLRPHEYAIRVSVISHEVCRTAVYTSVSWINVDGVGWCCEPIAQAAS
jgi:hypothetical protein